MKSEILNIINEQGTIFKDKRVFQINYTPRIWRYREQQYQQMASYCRGIKQNIPPQHLLLTGDYATGKTTTLKQFLHLLNDNFHNIRTVYINCKLNKTEYSILSEIYKQVMYINKPINGHNKQNIFNKIISEIVQKKQILIVALDDFDNIKNRTELNNTLYKLLRIPETETSAKISIFRVSNLGDLLIDDIVNTVYQQAEIRFTNYSYDQVYNILLERCKYGFYDDVIDDNTLQIVAERTFHRKDLRYGLNLLNQLGDLAEAKGEHCIKFKKI